MKADYYLKRLKQKDIKPTANRILVLKTLLSLSCPAGLNDLEMLIDTMDKSSIFRVLNVFLEHNLIHVIEDGNGIHKFEICSGEEHCSLSDMHAHFYCESCHQIFCFKNTPIPTIEFPEGFVSHSINYLVKGTCPKCKKNK